MNREIGILLSVMYVLSITLIVTKVLAFFGYIFLVMILLALVAFVIEDNKPSVHNCVHEHGNDKDI
jgi:hypothetical protein